MFALLAPLGHFEVISAVGSLLLIALVILLPQRRLVLVGGVGLYSGLALLLMVDMAVLRAIDFILMAWSGIF